MSDQPIALWRCGVCGFENAGDVCAKCYGVKCRVCHDSIYRDESIHRDALGAEHMRCSGGAQRVRRAAMGMPREHVPFVRGGDQSAG